MALTTEQAPTGQLKRPHLHFVWKPASQPNASWKGWLVGYYWRETPRRLNVVFSVRGMMLWTASLSFAAYLVAAAVLVTIWNRSPYNQVGYLDVVLPTRWAELRALRGKGLIAEGIAEIRAKRYAIGIMRLTQGVARNPQHFEGRLELARLYAQMGRMHQARQLLAEGLRYGTPPRTFRETLFAITAYIEDYPGLLSLIEQIRQGVTEQVRRDLLGWEARALEKLRRPEELNRLRLALRDQTPSVAVEAAWARSQRLAEPREALAELRKDRARFGTPTESLELQLELAAFARDAEAAEDALRAWFAIDPAGAMPRIREIVCRSRLGQVETAKSKIIDFFASYAADTAAIPMLFQALGDINDPVLLRFAYREAEQAGSASIPVQIYNVQALMLNGELQDARSALLVAEQAIKASGMNDREWALAAHRLLDAAQSPSDSTTSLLLNDLSHRRLNPDSFRFVWQVLARAKSIAAINVAILARNRFPQIRLADNEEQLVLQLPSAKPEPDQPIVIVPAPRRSLENEPKAPAANVIVNEATARREMIHLDELIAQRDLETATKVMLKLERSGFESLRSELQVRRIKIHGDKGELSELTSVLLLYLRTPAANQTVLRQLAERWNTPNQRDSALTLLREVQAKYPAAKWAVALKTEIERTLIITPAPNISEPR